MRKTTLIALCLTLVFLAGGVAEGASGGGVSGQISQVGGQISQAKQDQAAAVAELQTVERKLAALMDEYANTRAQLETTARDVVIASQTQLSLTGQLADAQALLNRRAADIYENGPAVSLQLFFGSSSLADYSSAQEYASRVLAVSEDDIARITQVRSSLDQTTHQLADQQAQLLAVKQHLDRIATDITAQVAAAMSVAAAAGVRVAQLQAQQQQLLAEQAAAAAALSAALHAGSIGSGCESGPVHDLIVADFPAAEVQTALMIATRESGCNPNAYNPIEVPPYGHAEGVFQILYPGIWEAWSARCGYTGADPYDPKANVAVAACTVAMEGWAPWAV